MILGAGRSARLPAGGGVAGVFTVLPLLAGGVAGSGSGSGLAASTMAGSLVADAVGVGASIGAGVVTGVVTGVGAGTDWAVTAIGPGRASELRETA